MARSLRCIKLLKGSKMVQGLLLSGLPASLRLEWLKLLKTPRFVCPCGGFGSLGYQSVALSRFSARVSLFIVFLAFNASRPVDLRASPEMLFPKPSMFKP